MLLIDHRGALLRYVEGLRKWQGSTTVYTDMGTLFVDTQYGVPEPGANLAILMPPNTDPYGMTLDVVDFIESKGRMVDEIDHKPNTPELRALYNHYALRSR